MTGGLVEFLRARLDEHEQAARAAANRMPSAWNAPDPERLALDRGDYPLSAGRGYEMEVFGQVWDVRDGSVAVHIARWDPARVLAEVQAKRRIIELHEGSHECSTYDHNGEVDTCTWVLADCSTLRLMAVPDAAHADYRTSWSPDVANYG